MIIRHINFKIPVKHNSASGNDDRPNETTASILIVTLQFIMNHMIHCHLLYMKAYYVEILLLLTTTPIMLIAMMHLVLIQS